jgi:ubiquitin carboxyl-terminal hydrolase 25
VVPQDSVSTTVEYAARQQDAAEIMMNIFDLLGCAIKPTSTMEDGEQIDMIKE